MQSGDGITTASAPEWTSLAFTGSVKVRLPDLPPRRYVDLLTAAVLLAIGVLLHGIVGALLMAMTAFGIGQVLGAWMPKVLPRPRTFDDSGVVTPRGFLWTLPLLVYLLLQWGPAVAAVGFLLVVALLGGWDRWRHYPERWVYAERTTRLACAPAMLVPGEPAQLALELPAGF
ncbi:MAG TPA: hypothetical protein VEI97_09610 [bacterium]|nr:hypothetical protein [bacterium]